jgi:TetR/AcrR family transcriptional regulator, transcriptional repressor for nem operon
MIKRTRNKERTREQILKIAFGEVFHRGFQAASVQEIVDKAGLTKGAFFHHFSTKRELGYALADETLREMVYERWLRPLEDYENPVEGVIANLKKIIDSTPEESLTHGCPLNNLIQEMSAVDPAFADKLQNVLLYWIAGIERHVRKAKVRGYLPKNVNARSLAEFIVMTHEGAFGLSKSLKSRKVFLSLHASLREHIRLLSRE